MRSVRWIGFVLVMLLLAGMLGATVRAEDLVEVRYPDSNFDPGPGWPEGWSPPPVPTEITPEMREYIDEMMKLYSGFTKVEMRVLDNLPKWTSEYPYFWEQDLTECGTTLFVYWLPNPDQSVLRRKFDLGTTIVRSSAVPCTMEQVRSITRDQQTSPEGKAATNRFFEFDAELTRSHQGLGRSFGSGATGSPEDIRVYLNNGRASLHFDVPAYLDTTVSRVRVPIRFVSEMMGAKVDWDGQTGQVTIRFETQSRKVLTAVPKEGYTYAEVFGEENYLPDSYHFTLEEKTVTIPARTIVLTIGQPTATVDGQQVSLDAPPVVKSGRTMVPIRFIAEQMGSKVYWVGATPIFRMSDGSYTGVYQVHIFTPFHPIFEYPSWYLENRAQRF